MIFFGHLGIGSALTRPFRRPDPYRAWRWLLLGTVLSDLIDKPLYYGLSFATGLKGADLGLICGTRTFGHTLLLALAFAALGLGRRSGPLIALAMGLLTHLALDAVFDPHPGYLLWPLTAFPVMPFKNLHDHVASWANVRLLIAEGVGAAWLLFEWRDRMRFSRGTPARKSREARPEAASDS